MLHIQRNDVKSRVLYYSWNDENKKCQWSLSETGRFDIETQGQHSAESAALNCFLQAELEAGAIDVT